MIGVMLSADSNEPPKVVSHALSCGHTRTIICAPDTPFYILAELMSESDAPCDICRVQREMIAQSN